MTAGPGRTNRDANLSRSDFLKVALGAGAAVVLPGCGGGNGSNGAQSTTQGSPAQGRPPSRPTGTLTIANPADPASFDPLAAANVQDLGIVDRNIFESLVDFDPQSSKLVPRLATSYSSNENATEWRFKLRSGVKFHDGTPLDAEAVKATLDYYRDGAGAWSPFIPKGTKIRASGDEVIVMNKNPMPDFARNQVVIRIISPQVVRKGSEAITKNPIGTGAFQFGSYRRGQRVVLEANPEYWDDGPYFERLNFQILPDAGARLSALQSGSVDIVIKAPPDQVRAVQSNQGIRVYSRQTWAANYLFFFCFQPPFDDLKARQAAALAIDHDAIIKGILLDKGAPQSSVMPPGTYGHADPAKTYAHDPEKAKALLGGVSASKRVSIMVPSESALSVSVAQAVANQLTEVGFQAQADSVDLGVYAKEFFATKPGKHQCAIGDNGWLNGGPEFFGLGFYQTVSKLKDPRFNEIVSATSTVPDGPERLSRLRAAQDYFAEQLPILANYTIEQSDLATTKLQGFTTPKDGYLYDYTKTWRA